MYLNDWSQKFFTILCGLSTGYRGQMAASTEAAYT